MERIGGPIKNAEDQPEDLNTYAKALDRGLDGFLREEINIHSHQRLQENFTAQN